MRGFLAYGLRIRSQIAIPGGLADDAAAAVQGADYTLAVPRPSSPLLSPLLSVVPGQLFAWALATAKGLDADEPRGLSKVTLAR